MDRESLLTYIPRITVRMRGNIIVNAHVNISHACFPIHKWPIHSPRIVGIALSSAGMPRAADRVAYKLRFEGQDSAGQYLWKRGTCTKTPTKLWPTWYEIALDTEGGERIMVVITRDNYGIGAGGCWRFIDPPPLAPPAAAADAATRTTANAPNRNVTILGGDDQVAQNIATMSDRKLRGEKSSSYIGVSWGVTGHVPAWTARFAETDRATVHLGRYHDEAEAARAYDTEARRQQRGTRAPGAHNGRGYYRLNFPTAEEQAAWSRRDRVGAAIAAETETETGQQRGVPSQENGHGHGHGHGHGDGDYDDDDDDDDGGGW